MSGEGPPDRPPPPPPPDPPKRESEAEAVTDQGGGPPQDFVEKHPADYQKSSSSPDATSTSAEPIAEPSGNREGSEASSSRDQQLENWKQADAKMYSDQLNRASPEQVGEMRDAAYKEFDTTLEQMQATALKSDPESDAAWRDAFDRNQIAQQRLEMIGGVDSTGNRPPGGGSANGSGEQPDQPLQIDLRSVQDIEPVHRTDTANDVSATARGLIDKAEQEKPQITEDIGQAASASGGAMIGHEENSDLGLHDYRVKSQESLERKIGDEVRDRGISASEAGEGVNDTLRYTITYPNDQLAEGYASAKSNLESNGYEFLKVNNTWSDSDPGAYRGINTTVESPNGQRFELQFHSHESFAVKQAGTHDLYEVSRDASQPEDVRDEAYVAGALYSSTLLDRPSGGYDPRPPGIEGIKSYSKLDDPGGIGGNGGPPGTGTDASVTQSEERAGESRAAQVAAEKTAAGAVESVRADARAEVMQAERDVGAADKEIRDMEDKAGPTDPADSNRLDDLQKTRAEASDRLNENLAVESNPESAVKGGEIQEAERARAEADQAERAAEEARRRQQNP